VFNIVGGSDLTLQEINAAAEVIYEAVDTNANIIFGALVDESMSGEIAITVIATGFPNPDGEEEDEVPQAIAQAIRSTSKQEAAPARSPPPPTQPREPAVVAREAPPRSPPPRVSSCNQI
jgi:cell division protein FtsZ